MRTTSSWLVLGIGICGLLLTAGSAAGQTGAPYAYAANTDGEQIFKITTSTGVTEEIPFPGSSYEDLVVGPDLLLYACDPTNGAIDRFDPDTYMVDSVYQSTALDLLEQPQCGTFTHNGDLIVADRGGAGVFVFRGIANGGAIPGPDLLLEASAAGPLPSDFRGEGLTQAAPGDLLIVDSGRGSVWRLFYDNMVGDFFDPKIAADALEELITGLDEPFGVARRSDGDIFVASDDGIERFTSSGGAAPADCSGPGRRDQPYFLEFAADDTLYAATTSNNRAKLWEFRTDDSDCSGTMIAEYRKPAYEPSLTGLAVPPTSRTVEKISGDFVDLDGESTARFNYSDHLYELSAGAGCDVTITATETDPASVQCLIDTVIGEDANDPDDTVVGQPVTDLGGRGFEQIYGIPSGTVCTAIPGDPEDFFRHAINQFTDIVPNPRIVACESTVCGPSEPDPVCEVITLTSYDPLSGIFEGDGRTSGKRGGFSSFFLTNVALTGEAAEAGCFCGFESPVGNLDMIDLDDPLFDPTSVPTFSIGGTLALKFKVASRPDSASCEDTEFLQNACSSGPYVDFAQALLSMGRIADADGNLLAEYEPVMVRSAGGSGSEDPAIFGNPNNPNKPYHYNLDTGAGYLPGIYRVVVVFLTDNDRARVRYIRLVN